MVQRGEVAVAGRKGNDRLWDLASRVYPDDPIVPVEEALRLRNERRLHALGIAAPVDRSAPSNPSTWGRQVSRPRSRVSVDCGESIRAISGGGSADAQRCFRRSTG